MKVRAVFRVAAVLLLCLTGGALAYSIVPTHPRVFLTAETLAVLQQSAPADTDFQQLKTHVDGCIADPAGTTTSLQGQTPDEVVRRFLLVAVVTDEAKYQNAAKNVVLQVAAMSPTGLDRTNYRIRNRLMAMALGYDWLHNQWTAAERTTLRNAMLDYINAFDADNYWDATDKYIASPKDFASSGSSRVANVAALAAVIAVYGEDNRFDAKRTMVVNNWINGYNPAVAVFGQGGAHHMGWRYGSHYGMLKPYLLWHAATGEKWASAYVSEQPNMYLYGVNRFGQVPLLGDCRDNKINQEIVDNLSVSMLVEKSGYAAWFSQKYFGSMGAQHKPLYIVSKAAAVAPQSPHGLPLARHFAGTGFVIARSSWDDDAAILTFKSSPFASRTHRHADENSFVLDYHGTLLTDSGYYDNWDTPHWNNYYSRSVAHNTLVVCPVSGAGDDGGQRVPDAVEPKNAAELREPRFTFGGVKAFSQNDACVWMRGNAAKAYDAGRVSAFDRDVLFVHKPAGLEHAAVFVVDRVVLPMPRIPTILWHVKEEPLFAPDKSFACVGNGSGGFARLELADAANLNVTALGGSGREFEVNGQNFAPGPLVGGMTGGDPGQWGRIEVAPKNSVTHQPFSTLILVDGQTLTEQRAVLGRFLSGDVWRGVRIGNALLLIAAKAVSEIEIAGFNAEAVRDVSEVHLAGVAPDAEVTLRTPRGVFTGHADTAGLLSMAVEPVDPTPGPSGGPTPTLSVTPTVTSGPSTPPSPTLSSYPTMSNERSAGGGGGCAVGSSCGVFLLLIPFGLWRR